MNTRRNIGQRRRTTVAKDNKAPPQALAEGLVMPLNPSRLTDAKVRASLAQMEKDITMQARAMTDQVNRQNVKRENPPVRSMAYRLRDFTRINPLILTQVIRVQRIPRHLWIRCI